MPIRRRGPLGQIIEPVTIFGVALVGVGWILLGIDVATRPRSSEAQPQ